MKKGILAFLLAAVASIGIYASTASAEPALKHYKDDFESYTVGSDFNGHNGWTTWTTIKEGTVNPSKNYTAALDDPSEGGAGNKAGAVIDLDTGNANTTANTFAQVDFDAMNGANADGIVTVQFRWLQTQECKQSRLQIRDGENTVGYIWINPGCNCGLCIGAPTSGVGGSVSTAWNAPGFSWGAASSDGTGTYTSPKKWNTIKFEFNFNTETIKAYWNGSAKSNTFYFAKAGITKIDNILISSSGDSNAGIYIDDLYVVEGTDLSIADVAAPAQYSIADATYDYAEGNTTVSASITKGEGDAFVYTAVYGADDTLAALDIAPITDATALDSNSVYAYNKVFTGMNAQNAKIMVWDSNMKPCCDIASCVEYVAPTPVPTAAPTATPVPTAEPTATPVPTATPGPTDDPNDISDVDAVPYTPADIDRSNVVQYVTEDEIQEIPAEADTYRTYPNGKMKAFLLSFDDGPGPNDVDILMPLFDQYHLNAAFNLVFHEPTEISGLIHVDNGNAEWLSYGGIQNQVVSRYSRYEIGNHGTDHNPDYMLNKEHYRHETGYNKYNIETIFNKECPGYIRAYRDYKADANPTSGVWRTAYLKYIGCRYMRNAPAKNVDWAYEPRYLKYDVPTNFFDWNPTIHMTISPMLSGQSGDFYTADVIDYFANTLDAGTTWKVLFGWGHGSDISSINWNNYTINTNSAYPAFVDACAKAEECSDVLWNVTPIEFVDYVNASRLTQVTVSNGEVTIYNPNAAIDVWMNVKGEDVLIPAGQTVVK